MQYVLAIISTFLFAFVEPLIINTLGISLFYICFALLFEKNKSYLVLGSLLFISLLLDVVFKHPLGVYAFAFVASYFVLRLLSSVFAEKEILQSTIRYFIASIIFYLVLKIFSQLPTFAMSFQILGMILLRSAITGIILGISNTIFGGGSIGHTVGLKFKK